MLPASTNTRSDRESVKGRIGGRTHEISRLIGRSLRAVIDYKALGENTIVLDCDVLQADGGTRTAAITGAYVALADAVAHLRSQGALTGEPLTGSVAAVSVGIIDGVPRLDLPYEEDVRAETDMNVVMTGDGQLRRGAGHRRGRGLRPRRARRAARARPRRAAPTSPGCSRRRSPASEVPRSSSPRATRKKLAEMRADPRRARARRRGARARRRGGVRRAGRGPARLRGQRPAQGAGRAGRDRAAVARRRQRAVRRRAQRDARACCRRAGRGRAEVGRRANNELLLAQLGDVPDERRGAHFTCAVAFCHPGREPSWSSRAGWTAGSSARPGAAAGSATTCCSPPTSTPRLTTAELDAGREGRDLPPRQALREIAPRRARSCSPADAAVRRRLERLTVVRPARVELALART